jgi:acyl dehydratase
MSKAGIDMEIPLFDQISIGDELPRVKKAPLTRTTLALFAGASGDHNPVHVDVDAARAAGLPDVIGHGMLSMAYLAQVLTEWVPQSAIRAYSARFVAPTRVGNVLTCIGEVVDKQCRDDQGTVRLQLQVIDQFGEIKIRGEAEVTLLILASPIAR